jgi:hypothetical protein
MGLKRIKVIFRRVDVSTIQRRLGTRSEQNQDNVALNNCIQGADFLRNQRFNHSPLAASILILL